MYQPSEVVLDHMSVLTRSVIRQVVAEAYRRGLDRVAVAALDGHHRAGLPVLVRLIGSNRRFCPGVGEVFIPSDHCEEAGVREFLDALATDLYAQTVLGRQECMELDGQGAVLFDGSEYLARRTAPLILLG